MVSKILTVIAPPAIEAITVMVPGQAGQAGPVGPPGPPDIISIGTVNTGAPGTQTIATISGASPNRLLNLTIPRGDQGIQGPPNTLTIGTINTLAEGQAATGTITGTSPNQILNLSIPRGYGVRGGGAAGDVLQKLTAADYDTAWVTVGTSSAGNNTVVRRDGNGWFAVDEISLTDQPASADRATRKDYVDAEVAKKITAFADPNADRMVFWDDSAGAFAALTPGATIPISGTTIDARVTSETQTGVVELATAAETTTGTDNTRAVHPAGLKVELNKKANSTHTHGLADLTATGTKDTTTFLRGDNTWAVPPGGAGGGTVTAANITDATVVGRNVLTAVDAPAARTAIGAGTSNLAIGTTSATAKAGDYQPTSANITDATAVGRSVLTAVDAPAARTAIGAGTGNGNVSGTGLTAIQKITQAAYDALGTKDAATLYVIQG